MIQINLLPVRQLRKRLQVRNEVAVFGAIVLLVIVIIGIIGLNMSHAVKSKKSENKVLSKKKASYQPILDEIDKLKKDKKEQETKLDVIKKLKTGSQTLVHVFDELAKVTPSNRVWLQSMSHSGDTMKISGIALDNATIAQYMRSIRGSDYFNSAELSAASQTVVAGAKLKSFGLTIGVTSPEAELEAKKKAEEEKKNPPKKKKKKK